MKIIYVILASYCDPTKVILFDGIFNDNDKSVLNSTLKGCQKYYGDRSPCVKSFHKTEPQNYRVLCTSKKKGSN